MEISQTTVVRMKELFELGDLAPEVEESFYTQFGGAILESALMQFLASLGEWEQASFATWVDAHSSDDNFLSQVLTMYPQFQTKVMEEIQINKDNFVSAL